MNKVIDANLIDNILLEGKKSVNKKDAAIKCLQCLDLTSLSSTDNEKTITELIQNSYVNELEGLKVAGLCVYPNFLKVLNEKLLDSEIRKIVVAGYFPSGQNPIELKLNEIKFAIDNGASEVDIVINRGAFLEGSYDIVSQETFKAKEICKDKILKVILEVGELGYNENMNKASKIAMEAGADFIKTSTGKIEKGADVYSFAVMLKSIKEFKEKNGVLKSIKAAGGISTFEQALNYYLLFSHYIGKEYLNPEYFRIGGSRLRDDLIKFIINQNPSNK